MIKNVTGNQCLCDIKNKLGDVSMVKMATKNALTMTTMKLQQLTTMAGDLPWKEKV